MQKGVGRIARRGKPGEMVFPGGLSPSGERLLNMDWTFYLVVGCSLAIAFLLVILGKRQDKRQAEEKA